MLCLAANLPTETTTIIDNGYGQGLSADRGVLPESQFSCSTDCKESLKQHKGRWPVPRRNTKTKKRGSRGGVRARLRRRGTRFPLLTITLSNVRSLNNKVEELVARVNLETDFKLCNLICLTETWLKPESVVSIAGYTTIRADRDNTCRGNQ